MKMQKKFYNRFSFTVIFGITVLFLSVLLVRNVVAQSDDVNNQSTPESSSAEIFATTENQSDQPWSSSAEIISDPDVKIQNPAAAEPEAEDALNALVSWRITGAALKPRENDVSYTISGSGGCVYVSGGDASTVWHTPVMLPQGATVDTLRIYYYDTNASNSSAWFTIYDLYGAIVQEWSVATTGSSGNSFNDSAAIDHVVDYNVYSYLINWRPSITGSTMQLCGFRIFYEPPPFGINFLPAVQK